VKKKNLSYCGCHMGYVPVHNSGFVLYIIVDLRVDLELFSDRHIGELSGAGQQSKWVNIM
jgi:hypothetical protein